jgi:hypothetical protein
MNIHQLSLKANIKIEEEMSRFNFSGDLALSEHFRKIQFSTFWLVRNYAVYGGSTIIL